MWIKVSELIKGLVVILNVSEENGLLLLVWCLILFFWLLIFLIVGILVGDGRNLIIVFRIVCMFLFLNVLL